MPILNRRVELDFDPAAVPAAWYGDDLHLTTLLTSLSLLFPEGERFFVEAVRRYKDRIDDPELREAVDAFIAQEAMHGKQHRAFNALLEARGPGVSGPAEAQLKRLLAFGRRTLGGRGRLAVTCALEHFTAIMAEQLLSDDAHLGAMHEGVRGLWAWHALEESEHKAVAFDVYRAVGGTYRMRVALMLTTSAFFFGELLNVHARFLPRPGRARERRGLGARRWLPLGAPGALREARAGLPRVLQARLPPRGPGHAGARGALERRPLRSAGRAEGEPPRRLRRRGALTPPAALRPCDPRRTPPRARRTLRGAPRASAPPRARGARPPSAPRAPAAGA